MIAEVTLSDFLMLSAKQRATCHGAAVNVMYRMKRGSIKQYAVDVPTGHNLRRGRIA